MIEPRPRLGLLLTIVAVLGVLLAVTSACSLVTGRNDRPTGNSPEVNQELAADIQGEIVDALPGAEVLGANYRDDIGNAVPLRSGPGPADRLGAGLQHPYPRPSGLH